VAFTTPNADINQSEATLSRLPTVLQTTLELDDLIRLFQDELQKIIAYDCLHYQYRDVLSDINTAKRSHHNCTYRLEMNAVWLGELTLTRGKKIRTE